MRRIAAVLALVAVVVAGSALAAELKAPATLETEPFLDANDEDADDPAIWVHPSDSSRSIVIGDGDDEPFEDATNFKFVRWQDLARPLGLEIDTTSGDPRR